MGVHDKKKAPPYSMVHHIGKREDVQKSYDAMINGATLSGLNKEALFILDYPFNDETKEKYDEQFLGYLEALIKTKEYS